ncbi:non-homologous end-joining DNA ligase [Caldalkalibacillus salinus]|uniref:non-homologous end-joining DNA ligase n=1 Tax=Caldalkalibacillus salinus TaxID=2803787 RepID=UPI0019212EFE|nr:non-homologous end-joining DNA ligase [Caldalkalibacillus salinus]
MGSQAQDQKKVKIDGQTVSLTSLSKPLWPKADIKKARYIQYLHDVAPAMLPFLSNRLLTVIRYPHGVEDESFYQKNCPDYAPDFVQTQVAEDIEYIVCSDLPSLIWLGNQLAFEFHIPFQTIKSKGPSEIVFDLDPPSRDKFSLAIEAALMIKDIIDRLKLISYVKTSGNKGLQIYLPLPENTYSYEDTRRFTQFVAKYLVKKEPDWFTTERLKVNRGQKLYVDYLQHAEGKTIVAPYSARGNEEALVATPIHWHEVTKDLSPTDYPMTVIKERLAKGCPFKNFFKDKEKQNFQPVLDWLTEQGL